MGIRFAQIKRVFKIKKIRWLFPIWRRNRTKKPKVNILIYRQSKQRLNLGIIFKRFNQRKKTKIKNYWDSRKQ